MTVTISNSSQITRTVPVSYGTLLVDTFTGKPIDRWTSLPALPYEPKPYVPQSGPPPLTPEQLAELVKIMSTLHPAPKVAAKDPEPEIRTGYASPFGAPFENDRE